MKDQDKSPEKLEQVEIGNLPEKEFRIMILIVPLLPFHCSFSFVLEWRVSFLVGSGISLLMAVQQLIVILVLWQEMSARSFAPPF